MSVNELNPKDESSQTIDKQITGKEGFDEIQKAIEETSGRVIFNYWNDGKDHLKENRPFEHTIVEKNWKVIHGERWKIFTLDSVDDSKWNARDIMAYAKDVAGLIDFELLDMKELAEKNIGDLKKTVQYYSDLVRLSFLEAFGGTWIDISIILADSLENIFYNQLHTMKHKTLAGYSLSIHGSRKYGYVDGLENWFLMAKKGSKPLREWRKNTWKFVEDSPLRSDHPGTISIFHRPLFRHNPRKNKDPAHCEMIRNVRASVRRQTAKHRNYLWGYSTWKRAIIEHPEFRSELLFREAGPEQFGPLGHEHIFDHFTNRDMSGFSAMMGKNREKIARRANAKAEGDPYYVGFQAIKFPSFISGFRRFVDESGNLKYTSDTYENDSLIKDLTEAAVKSAKVKAPFVEDSDLLEKSLLAKEEMIKGTFSDMPGGVIFLQGYRWLLLSKYLLDSRDSRREKESKTSNTGNTRKRKLLLNTSLLICAKKKRHNNSHLMTRSLASSGVLS